MTELLSLPKNILILLLVFIFIFFLTGCAEYFYPPTIPVPQDLLPYLTEIKAQPDTMVLDVGESQSIISVTAFYSDSSAANIPLVNCIYYSNNPLFATITSDGLVTGISPSLTNIFITYNEGAISKSDTIIVNISSPATSAKLTSIEVSPIAMILNVGNSQTIDSVTAYYDDSSNANIDLMNCNYSSNNIACAIINSSGIITAVSEGTAIITISYTEDNIEKTDTMKVTVSNITQNEVVYRALCVGVGDYILGSDNDLNAPPYDVDRIRQILQQCRFGTSNTIFSNITYLKDWQAIKSNILQSISSTFSGADSNDISYFYFSGHGSRVENTSYICPADITSFVNSAISVDELESALSAIPGTKVVFLDSCYSGGFIGKGKEEIIVSLEELESFNDEVINVFSQAQPKGLLTTNQYKVLTSCHYNQECMGLSPTTPGDFDPFGVFTMGLCKGCGYYVSYPADTNMGTMVSLQEAYLYVKNWVFSYRISQDVQVYPNNSTFTIIEY